MANMTSSVSASQVAGELVSATFEEIPALVEHYREDPRQQVIKACERALKRHAKELAERERVNGMYELMHELGGDGVVVGVDEVGRGSVAGPLTVWIMFFNLNSVTEWIILPKSIYVIRQSILMN